MSKYVFMHLHLRFQPSSIFGKQLYKNVTHHTFLICSFIPSLHGGYAGLHSTAFLISMHFIILYIIHTNQEISRQHSK